MRDMQQRVLARLKKIAGEAGLEFVLNQAWANTGQVLLQTEDFETALALGYSFQDGYCTISARYPDRPVPLTDPFKTLPSGTVVRTRDDDYRVERGVVTWHMLRYDDGARIRAMFDVVTGLLAKPEPVPAEPCDECGEWYDDEHDRGCSLHPDNEVAR